MDWERRAIVRTHTLEKPIHYAGDEISEIEFREPTGWLQRELSRAQTLNGHAKAADLQDPAAIMFHHLTNLDFSVVDQMPLRESNRILTIMSEICAEGTDEGKS